MSFIRSLFSQVVATRAPTKWKRSTLLAVIGLLIAVPLVVAYFYGRAEARQNLRDDELVQKFECWPPDKCVADFNRDGVAESIAIVDREVVVKVAGRDVFRTAFDYQDGTFRTHFAINCTSGKPTLLIYDGVNHQPPMSAAYAWGGADLQAMMGTRARCMLRKG